VEGVEGGCRHWFEREIEGDADKEGRKKERRKKDAGAKIRSGFLYFVFFIIYIFLI
jgi:hypothetical protein